MSKIRKNIDAVNKLVQFEIKEPCSSISFELEGEGVSAADLNYHVELISKNKRNEILYNQKNSTLRNLLNSFIPRLKNLVPLTLGKNLQLNNDTFVRVTISWESNVNPNSFSYRLNRVIDSTSVPLVIKEVTAGTVDTEYFPLLMVGRDVESLETVVMLEDDNGVITPQKVSYSKEYIEAMRPNVIGVHVFYLPLFVTQNQKVEIEGSDSEKHYLING